MIFSDSNTVKTPKQQREKKSTEHPVIFSQVNVGLAQNCKLPSTIKSHLDIMWSISLDESNITLEGFIPFDLEM